MFSILIEFFFYLKQNLFGLLQKNLTILKILILNVLKLNKFGSN